MNKWEKFHSSYSVVGIDKPNTGASSLSADWLSEAEQDRMTINGIKLPRFAKHYSRFETKDDVKRFFDEVILKDLKNTDSDKKVDIINYLETVFHQGGLMYPE